MEAPEKPLTEEEKKLLISNGWKFLYSEFIYIPDDYDGCIAVGISSIRRVLDGIYRKQKREQVNG